MHCRAIQIIGLWLFRRQKPLLYCLVYSSCCSQCQPWQLLLLCLPKWSSHHCDIRHWGNSLLHNFLSHYLHCRERILCVVKTIATTIAWELARELWAVFSGDREGSITHSLFVFSLLSWHNHVVKAFIHLLDAQPIYSVPTYVTCITYRDLQVDGMNNYFTFYCFKI